MLWRASIFSLPILQPILKNISTTLASRFAYSRSAGNPAIIEYWENLVLNIFWKSEPILSMQSRIMYVLSWLFLVIISGKLKLVFKIPVSQKDYASQICLLCLCYVTQLDCFHFDWFFYIVFIMMLLFLPRHHRYSLKGTFFHIY